MSEREPAEEIERAASEWVARLEGRSAELDDLFEAWIAGDERRFGAFVRAKAASHLLTTAAAIDSSALELSLTRPSVDRRSLLMGAAAAASVGAALVATWQLREPVSRFALGGVHGRHVLSDGTIVWLSRDARASGAFDSRRRQIDLEHGDAWFDVAKDAKRPFQVRAGNLEVNAIGTAFLVSHEGDRKQVMVTEGIVDIVRGEAAKSATLRLRQGMRALVRSGDPLEVSTVTADEEGRALAWREGKVALDGESVDEAARQFNRFNTTKIVVDDRALGAQPVTGLFDAADPEAFAAAVALSFGATSQRIGAQIRLDRKKSRGPRTEG